MRAAASGTSGRITRIARGVSRKTLLRTAGIESPPNARVPVNISYSTAPVEKMSERASTGLPSACSGDIYAAVPRTVPAAVAGPVVRVLSPGLLRDCRLASPKSRILSTPAPVTITLAGLMSRCTIPAACAAPRPEAIWLA